MSKIILGTKLGMSQIFTEQGRVIPVTLISCGPCKVTQTKTKDKDGYNAMQVGFGTKKKLSPAMKGHLKGLEFFRWLRELRLSENQEPTVKRGDVIDVSSFAEKEEVSVTGVSKGKGFQGVVKRWGFAGHFHTHGTKNTERAPGAIGSGFPQHVLKGRKMAGRMGGDQMTRRMKIVKVDAKNNILMLDGPVAGVAGSLVEIRSN
ncbi:MAG: 50S ribosomal protein L3 [Candidatus Spechtbacteria bacterium]|nr:50S ribosomal protein L3 [Candidatus Spechtbacteria bacterium]